MKIFCSRHSDDLDSYIGQDIWVKVDSYYGQSYYVRLLSKKDEEYDPYYVCNCVLSDIVDDPDTLIDNYSTDAADLLSETNLDCSAIWISEPIDCITTEELGDICQWDQSEDRGEVI